MTIVTMALQDLREKKVMLIAPIAEIREYRDLILALRMRADQLDISRETIDIVAGLPDRLTSKLLTLSPIKNIGMASLGPLLGALAMKLVAIPDPEALERNRSRYVPRNHAA
jgi:hypothetical protein